MTETTEATEDTAPDDAARRTREDTELLIWFGLLLISAVHLGYVLGTRP